MLTLLAYQSPNQLLYLFPLLLLQAPDNDNMILPMWTIFVIAMGGFAGTLLFVVAALWWCRTGSSNGDKSRYHLVPRPNAPGGRDLVITVKGLNADEVGWRLVVEGVLVLVQKHSMILIIIETLIEKAREFLVQLAVLVVLAVESMIAMELRL
jgi:hypothetical protein